MFLLRRRKKQYIIKVSNLDIPHLYGYSSNKYYTKEVIKMAKKIPSTKQEEQKDRERNMMVYKANTMMQKGRHDLSKQEQRAVIYAVSKIKPTDNIFEEYCFEIKDFFRICGIENESYTKLKGLLQKLSDRSWWIEIDDEGTESLVRWFSTLRINKGSGKVKIKFHEDMMPFLLELAKRGKLYTKYNLRFILPMDSQYGIRLYELLKSYGNNPFWCFEVDRLKKSLNAENYKRWPDFRRYVLEPAVRDINTYSDLTVSYQAEKEGRSYSRIEFFISPKKGADLTTVCIEGERKLDGDWRDK